MFSKRPEYTPPVIRQLPSINSETSIHGVDTSAPRTINRDRRAPSNLSPYMAEIEVLSLLMEATQESPRNDSSIRARPRNDSKHDTSSFSNSNVNITTIGSTKNTIDQRRGFSRRKILPDELTIEQPSLSLIHKDEHLKNLYSKLRNKYENEAKPEQKPGFRRGKYTVGESDSETNTQCNLRKIGTALSYAAYTVNNIEKVSKELATNE
ncbi:unnamed protein product [Sphagnum jensenii]